MDCALWLNKQKIRDAAEIPRNLDIASLRGYFLAGNLVEWLEEHGGAAYAEKLRKIPPDCPDLNSKISEIFGGSPIPGKPLDGSSSPNPAPTGRYSSFISFGSFGSFGSLSAFGSLWKLLGSFGSFRLTSGLHEWEWEWLFTLGGYGGSFGSFSFTSGRYGFALETLLTRLKFGSFGSFSLGSFPFSLEELSGSCHGFPILDEYDIILLQTLLNCPLDRFGYGIHVI